MVYSKRTNRLIKEKLKISNATIGIFMILFLASGFLVTNNLISSMLTKIGWGITCLFLLSKVKVLDKVVLACFCCLMGTMWLSMLFNQEDIQIGVYISFSFITAFLMVNAFGIEEFKESYIKIILFLSICSLIGFALFSAFPVLEKLFVVKNLVGRRYSNLIVYVHPHTFDRNQSIFWEPGAFQTYIGLALLFELSKEKVNIYRFLVLVITIITTFSTTGYIALVFVFLMALFRLKKANRKIKVVASVAMIVFLLALLVYKDVFFGGSGNTVFGKIVHFFSAKVYKNTKKVTSASVRYWGIIKPIEEFFKSPLLGYGYEGLRKLLYEYTRGMNTCTFVNWFAVYGVFHGSIMLAGIIRFAGKLMERKLDVILAVGILFVLTMSENYVHNASIMMLALYGYMPKEKCIHANS